MGETNRGRAALGRLRLGLVDAAHDLDALEAALSAAQEREAAVVRCVENQRQTIVALEDRCKEVRQERDAIQETLTAVEHEVAIVYYHITGSRISKCNTLASVVISEADELAEKDIDGAVAEAEGREKALKALLSKYGDHHPKCSKRRFDPADECSCGWSYDPDVKAALQPAKGANQ